MILFFSSSTSFLSYPKTRQIKTKNTLKITVDSIEREYYIHIPENLPSGAPLLMVFHGYSGTALNTMQTTKFKELADQKRFAVCYPQGLLDKEGNAFWQVGYAFHKKIKVNDIKFVKKLLEKIRLEYQLSKTNIFMTGFSNGGDFCNLLSCETTDVFRATAPIISCFMEEFYDTCPSANSIPTLMLNGTKDPITLWSGDKKNTQGYGPYLSTQEMIDFRLKQIKHFKVSLDTIRSTDLNETTFVTIEKYSAAQSQEQVWMLSYVNGGHGYPDYLNLENRIWEFFQLYLN